MKQDHPLFNKVDAFIDVGLEMRPCDDNLVLIANLERSKQLLTGICGGSFPPDDVSLGSADSDDKSTEENVAVDESSSRMHSDYVDQLVELKRLSPVNSYKTHFTRCLGNTHTSSIRMNAVMDNSPNSEKVMLAHPTPAFVVGGQIYEPQIRMESMHQQRPLRKSILSIIPHSINICHSGGHLVDTTTTDSMVVVAEQLKVLTEIYEHREMRRENETSNVLRMELFLAYNNGGEVVGALPDFDPTSCDNMFIKEHVDLFE
jgi:hypothetical protein